MLRIIKIVKKITNKISSNSGFRFDEEQKKNNIKINFQQIIAKNIRNNNID